MLRVNNEINTNSILQNSIKSLSTSNNDFLNIINSKINTKTMDDIFQEAADKYNVPVELLKAIGKAESDFDANAVSSCGAQGVMQLMPATASSLGVTNPFDAEQNIMGGSKYISQLIDKYDGDVKLALAAYNAGSGNVAKYGGIPPFKETQNYVEKVMKYAGESISTPNYVKNDSTNSYIPSVSSSYENIYNEIFNFDEYTMEDYQLFLTLFKLKLNTITPLDDESKYNSAYNDSFAFFNRFI